MEGREKQKEGEKGGGREEEQEDEMEGKYSVNLMELMCNQCLNMNRTIELILTRYRTNWIRHKSKKLHVE